jgi:hypothetical protein
MKNWLGNWDWDHVGNGIALYPNVVGSEVALNRGEVAPVLRETNIFLNGDVENIHLVIAS